MKIKTNLTQLLALLISTTAAGLNATENPAHSVTVYLTAKDTGQRLAKTADLAFIAMPQPSEKEQCVFVDGTKRFQTLVGIGGALTDAAAETFYKLPRDNEGWALMNGKRASKPKQSVLLLLQAFSSEIDKWRSVRRAGSRR